VNGPPRQTPQEGEAERPRSRAGRVLGILAALGFSLLMWAFIAMAVLGLVLKLFG
jgi:hypothetical protein